ncbi:hypothetical protein OTB20_17205 [Streptomyces sp. H27-H1]|uniref:hypothetical protein n=1 Tax=Streptomyces sp. H27-H1 TaxID=2996461 RepID=UPI00227138D2|nr:hypothetical protein [Streptomyces sp. H27-H1]MCY0927919.1 hypothetical protein [Streptomyces sp. H27-H1]
MVLSPPIAPILAQAAESMPTPKTAGSLAFEQKIDRHGALLFTSLVPGGPVLSQTWGGSPAGRRPP